VVLISVYFGYNKCSVQYGTLFVLIGILLWTILEYIIHRFIFHYMPSSENGKKIHFLVHGVHHDYPRDSTRLVMPLIVSVPLAIIFYLLFFYTAGNYNLNFFAGLVIGYLCYDSIHYATHHFKMNKGISKFLKEYHLRHHYNDPSKSFGVSSPLWDYVFGTSPKKIN
jgi:sterol desaturase/sphingolipid hydroxylase (fatty acid hydroxylase superfamily)